MIVYKNRFFPILLLFSLFMVNAQNTFRNFGDVRIHNNANLQLSTNMINDGSINMDSGNLSFYGQNSLEVSGTFPINAFNIEVATEELIVSNLLLIKNDLHFVYGDITNNKSDTNSLIIFLENSDYFGESVISKINGLAHVSGKNNFLFPVGDISRLQPLKIDSESNQENMLCAYFLDNPFANNTNSENIEAVSITEYWFLSSQIPTKITISWDEESNLNMLMDNLNRLSLVGYSIINQQWEKIKTENITGDLEQGFLNSDIFLPNNYSALTFGATNDRGSVLSDSFLASIGNYYVSPNNDGINDKLIFSELSEFPENKLSIYDRNGLKVFEQENYTNEFTGIGNTSGLYINRLAGLPEGVYFYLIDITPSNQEFQGFIFLER